MEDNEKQPQTSQTQPGWSPNEQQKFNEYLVPINRSGWAIAAGYVALLNIIFILSFIFAPLSIFLAIMALRDLKKNPSKKGKGRVYFAFIMSALGAGLLLTLVIFHNA